MRSIQNDKETPTLQNVYMFKLEALRLIEEADRTARGMAMYLGIRRNQLYKWKKQLAQKGEVASSKKGRPINAEQSEATTLREEVKRFREESDILKKVAI